MADSVLVSIEYGIATLTLNRPDRLNAWHTPMREAVAGALGELNRDSSVGAIIITGAGELAFSAGQDLAETMAFESGEAGREWFLTWRAFYDSLRNLDKGCVAALNGVAAGSAFQFAMLTDVRVGHAGIRMGQPDIDSGIPSVLGPLLMLPRLGLSEEQANEIGVVVEHHRNPHPLADPARGEPVGKPVHRCVEFGERERATAVHEVDPMRIANGAALEEPPQGHVVRDESHPFYPGNRIARSSDQRPPRAGEGIIEARRAGRHTGCRQDARHRVNHHSAASEDKTCQTNRLRTTRF